MRHGLHAIPSVRVSGFALIELLVVIAVAAILAAVALPAYQEQVRKGRRADAVALLAKVQHAQEQFRTNHAAYTDELGETGLNVSSTSQSGHYTVSISGTSRTGYTATASVVSSSPQAADHQCTTLVLKVDLGDVQYCSRGTDDEAESCGGNRCWNNS